MAHRRDNVCSSKWKRVLIAVQRILNTGGEAFWPSLHSTETALPFADREYSNGAYAKIAHVAPVSLYAIASDKNGLRGKQSPVSGNDIACQVQFMALLPARVQT
jgi:hypothetical protein